MMSLFGPRAKRLTSSLSEDKRDEAVWTKDAKEAVPVPWDQRLKLKLEEFRGNSFHIIVEENIQIEGLLVPLVLKFTPTSGEVQMRQSLMSRDPILWEILGDDDPVDKDDETINRSEAWDGTQVVDHEDEGLEQHENEEVKLVFPRNQTSMSFTELKMNGHPPTIELGSVTNQVPLSDALKIERLKQKGWVVKVIEEMEFVGIEHSEKDMNAFLEGLIPIKRKIGRDCSAQSC